MAWSIWGNMGARSSARGSTSFRADIQGLRAVAILLVLLFHFAIPGFSSGFIGVDIFFVISGFLVTQISVGGREATPPSLLAFYLSRVTRIYPAMLALVGTLLALGYLFLEPGAYLRLGRHALLSLAGVVNYRFYSEADYFAPSQESNWLLHLWSLSVELQFYLLLPPILRWVKRRAPQRLTAVLLGLCSLSLACSLYVGSSHASAAFYFMPLRLWQFLLGALAFGWRDAIPAPWRPRASLAGLLLIAAALPLMAHDVLPKTCSGVLPVIGTALVLAAPSGVKILTNPVSQFLGVVSYSLYLWHWPVWVGAKQYGRGGTALDAAAAGALTLALAYVSWRTVERPFQRSSARRLDARYPALLAGATSAVLAMAGAVVVLGGFPKRVPRLIADVASFATTGADIENGRCFISPPDGGEKLADDCFASLAPNSGSPGAGAAIMGAGRPAEVMLFGDSHAAHLRPGFDSSQLLRPFRLTQVTGGACPPLLFERQGLPNAVAGGFEPITGFAVGCASITQRAFSYIESARPRVVVLSGRWSFYDGHSTDVVRELEKVILTLSRLEEKALVVGPIPEWTPTLPQKAFEAFFRHGGKLPERMRDPAHAAIKRLDRRLAVITRKLGAGYVSLVDLLCTQDGCLTQVNVRNEKALISWDSAHLTTLGSEWLVEHAIAPAIARMSELRGSGIGALAR